MRRWGHPHSVQAAIEAGFPVEMFLDGGRCPLYTEPAWRNEIRVTANRVGSSLASAAENLLWALT